MRSQPKKVNKCYKNLIILQRQSGVVSEQEERNVPVEKVDAMADMATTQFIDDAVVHVEEETFVSKLSKMFLDANDTQSVEESLHSFLSRPIELAGGAFSTSDILTTFTDFAFPNEVFNSTYGGVWLDKLKGFYGLRADFRVKIVFNSNRFQQGRYMMYWIPLCGAVRDATNFRENLRRTQLSHTLVQRTTVRHVEFDINSGTSAELVIPYASVDTFFPITDLISGSYNRILGTLTICPYSPLMATSGSLVVPYTLYVSMENVKLFGAVEPQSGLISKENKGRGVSEQESNVPNGPVSGVAKKFANAFDALSGVPLIGGYALGASWIADRVSQTAAIFGYSKPSQGDSVNKMMILNHANHNVVDGDSPVRPFAFMAKPATVPVVGATGSSVDQMDFSFLKSIYAWHSSTPWTTLNLRNAILHSFDVTPHVWYLDNPRNMSPVSFIAHHFLAWRGSMKYRIKFVKTEFHSGRISIEFSPTSVRTYDPAVNPAYLNRQIVDIRDIEEVEFVVPYIATTPWCHPDEIIGKIYVRIVDPLVAPATVSSSINILVEFAGGEDMEFGIPSSTRLTPTYVVDRQSGLGNTRKVSFTIGNSNIGTADDVTFSSATIGDKVSSVRTYIKRYSSLNSCGTSYGLNAPLLVVQPDFIGVPAAIQPPLVGYSPSCDILGRWAICYGMWSGGVRLKDVMSFELTSTTTGTSKVTSFIRLHNGTPGLNTTLTSIGQVGEIVADTSHSVLQQVDGINSAIEVEIPQYTTTLARAVGDCVIYRVGDGAEGIRSDSMTQMFLHFSPPRGTTVTGADINKHFHNLYRSGSDDTNFSVFISVPPMSTSAVFSPNHQYSL